MPKIIKIGKYLFKLQLKMSGVFFLRHSVDSTPVFSIENTCSDLPVCSTVKDLGITVNNFLTPCYHVRVATCVIHFLFALWTRFVSFNCICKILYLRQAHLTSLSAVLVFRLLPRYCYCCGSTETTSLCSS